MLNAGLCFRFEVSPSGEYVGLMGRFGNLHFLNSRSKEKAFSLKMNEECTAIAFTPSGNQIYSHGGELECFIIVIA